MTSGGAEEGSRTRVGDRWWWLGLTVLFLASRLVFYAFGVRFDAAPLAEFWQYLDPGLLEQDLLSSVFHLHSQPPLFNLFLGLVLKLSPVAPALAFHGLYQAAGLVCHLATFALMRWLAVGRLAAAVLSTVLVVRPSFVLFENWLMYDVPVTALLCLAAVWLALFARRGAARYAHAFFATLLLLCAARSLFHLVYFLAALALLAGLTRGRRRRIVLGAAAGPLLLLVLLYVKSWLLFGHAGPSTWLGMNLARIATAAMSPQELARLHAQGHLSRTATVPPFSPPGSYGRQHFEGARYPGIAALAERFKSTGSVNYNHEAYISISRAYADDARWIVTHRPGAYLHGVAKAWYNYFKPQTEISHVSANRDRLRGYAAAGARVLYGRLPFSFEYRGEEKPIYLFSMLGVPLLILYAFYRARQGGPASRLVLAFMALSAVYVALLGNSLEVWENQRFRFYTDPFFAVFFALAAERAIRWIRPDHGTGDHDGVVRSRGASREQSTAGSR